MLHGWPKRHHNITFVSLMKSETMCRCPCVKEYRPFNFNSSCLNRSLKRQTWTFTHLISWDYLEWYLGLQSHQCFLSSQETFEYTEILKILVALTIVAGSTYSYILYNMCYMNIHFCDFFISSQELINMISGWVRFSHKDYHTKAIFPGIILLILINFQLIQVIISILLDFQRLKEVE